MQIGMISLGRTGMNMARGLLKGGQEVIAYYREPPSEGFKKDRKNEARE